ncbi:MAG: MFS transporter [Treponema sp.]|jgi:MFS family permease|nr:MFS transporter [Treponema sp.]
MAKKMISPRRCIAVSEAFVLYLLTGAACLILGSSLPQLIRHFNSELAAVAALGSAFALGRVATVFFMGRLTEKTGPKWVVGIGLLLLFCFFAGVSLARSVKMAMIFSVLGGIGMGVQDTACPVIFIRAFPVHYPGAMSVGQAFFGAGCFMPSLLLGFILKRGLPFLHVYHFFAGLCALMLLLWIFMEPEKDASGDPHAAPEEGGKASGSRWLLFALICVFYCAVTNTISLYTTSYGILLGFLPEQAVFLLTFYNTGSMLGSLLFSAVMRKIRPVNLLCINLGTALLFFFSLFFIRRFIPLVISYFFAGFGLGVLFSALILIAVDLYSGRAGRAGALTAVVCGGADIITPLVTGALITVCGISANLWFVRGALTLALTASLVFRFVHEKPRRMYGYSIQKCAK